uniref:Peptidase_M13 domain-containing protein n=1 Tax=Schistosoma mansoni TaxID=6183 RepID=A0A5K4F6P1_SCHMA
MAAINYYQSCTTNSKEETSTRKEKIVQLISFLFNGWLSPLGSDNNGFNISKNISDDKLFNLTSLILPLIFQNGRTSIFSFNVVRSRNKSINQYIYPVKSGEGIEEQIFKFLENLKAQENKEELAKGVFNLYSDIKNAIPVDNQYTVVPFENLIQICSVIDWNVLFESIFRELKYESYKNLKIIVYNPDSLQKVCDIHMLAMNTTSGKRILHTVIVINFLYNMRSTLNQYFGEFHFFDNPKLLEKTPTSCIDEVKENFQWTIERNHEYSSISESRKREVLEIFDELKITLIQLLSSNSWFTENKGIIDKIKNINLSIISSESLNAKERENKDFIFNDKMLENNYFTNAYYSQKTKLLKSFDATLHKYDEPEVSSFIPYISGLDRDYNIHISTGFLHPPYFNGSYSMSEKYGIIGWIMGRQLMSAVSSDFQKDRPEQSQFICEASDLRSFESQLCCLSKQNSSRIFGRENLRSLSNDINGLMLSFTTYGRLCMRNRKHLDGELFFSTFTKMMCAGYFNETIHNKFKSSKLKYSFSVNDLLKHSQEFSDVYQCPVYSKMNHAKKCIL